MHGFVLLNPRGIKGTRSVAGSTTGKEAKPKKAAKGKSPKKGSDKVGKPRKGGKKGRA